MTTIIIKDLKNVRLAKNQFDNWNELIDCYFQTKGMVVLEQVDEASLARQVCDELNISMQQGGEGLVDFQG